MAFELDSVIELVTALVMSTFTRTSLPPSLSILASFQITRKSGILRLPLREGR